MYCKYVVDRILVLATLAILYCMHMHDGVLVCRSTYMDANLITKEELRKTQDSSQMNRERFEYICDAYIYIYMDVHSHLNSSSARIYVVDTFSTDEFLHA
jgi:hypothetical protein